MVARRLITALGIALAVSLIFTFFVFRNMGKTQRVEAAPYRYVAAAQQLDPGTLLSATNLKMVEWPAGSPLEGAFTKPEDLNGRTLLYPVPAGQPITDKLLSAAGAGVGLSAKIPDGMRAISLRSDEIVGVAGFLLPGTHVDVLVTYRPQVNGTTAPQPVTQIVLQDVAVLAAGQNTQPDPQGKPTTTNVVTLLVTPDDAEKVTLASAQGTVQFVLRNGSDREQVEGAAMGTFGAPPVEPKPQTAVAPVKKVTPPADEKKPYVIQTIRGDKMSEEKFSDHP